jgi:hypothetical protein
LSSANDRGAVEQQLLLIDAVHAALRDGEAAPIVLSCIRETLLEIDGEAYSALRSTATGRAAPDASWVRLKHLVPVHKQDMFQQLLSRVGAVSVSQLQPPYALTSALCPCGVPTEAVAIIVCLRAYLDEQGQPLLLPDHCDAAQLLHPAPVIEFIRALLNMSCTIFPVAESVPASHLPLSTAVHGDDASAPSKRNSLVPLGVRPGSTVVASPNEADDIDAASGKRSSLFKRGSAVLTAPLAPAAAFCSSTPIISFLASSICRSSHGMFADSDGGSIRRVAALHCSALASPHTPCSVARKVEGLMLLRASLMQACALAMISPAFNFHALQLAPPSPFIPREKSISSANALSEPPPVDVLWQQEDGIVQQGAIYCATVERLVPAALDVHCRPDCVQVAFITDPAAMGDIHSQKVFLLTYPAKSSAVGCSGVSPDSSVTDGQVPIVRAAA